MPHPGRGTAAVPGIVEPLTSRELEVLEMLAAGRSNQVIARQLVVTLNTVKKHVSHVLGKLGATNRTEAVARARRTQCQSGPTLNVPNCGWRTSTKAGRSCLIE